MEDLSLKEIKTFKDLEDEVVSSNKCCACGACVAYCEIQGFDVIEMEGYTPKFKSDKNAENCKECGLCFYICPQTEPLTDKLNGLYLIEDELGHISDVISAKTTNAKIKEVGQDGGVVSTILSYLFDTNQIDAAIVSEYDENFQPIPTLIDNKDDLIKSAGTRYSISSNILPLKDLYAMADKLIEEHTNVYDIDQLSLAFVGTPCQCRAISKMKLLNVKPAHVINYVFSLFCFENFDYAKLMEIIKSKTKIEPSQIKKTQIKKNMFVTSKDGKTVEINIKDLDDAVRSHCNECDEFVGRFSDLSFGGSGAPTGYSMIIMRSEKAQNLIDSVISEGLIEKYKIPAEQYLEWKPKKINWFRKMTSFKTKK